MTEFRSVLLVNCFPDEQEMYGESLRLAGLSCTHKCDAAEAFHEAARIEPDVIVTEIVTVGPFDGVGLIRRLREDRRTAPIAVIVITARIFESDRQRAINAGADIFLLKPCLPDMIVSEVQRAAALTRRRRFGQM